MYANNDILFPHSAIASLKDLRGEKWRDLIEHILKLKETDEETLAFMLMMIRLNGCLDCETDSFRAMKGCAHCAMQTVRRYKGSDEELIAEYNKALVDIRRFGDDTKKVSSLIPESADL